MLEKNSKCEKIEKELKDSQERFKIMFENSPIATWLDDFSLIFEYFDKLKASGINDIENFLLNNQAELSKLSELINVIDINKATLEIYEAKTKNELLSVLKQKFTKLSPQTLKKGLLDIWNGSEEGEFNSIIETLNNKEKYVIINYRKLPISNKKSFQYLITLKDITENKKSGSSISSMAEIIKIPSPEKEIVNKRKKENQAKKINILWVDDEEIIRDVAKNYIELIDQNGKTAQDGIEALSLLKEDHYDLVITDISMPNMDGWQLLDEIRRLYSDTIKVIIVTGWGGSLPEDIDKSPPFYTSLQKPIQLKSLKEVIDAI